MMKRYCISIVIIKLFQAEIVLCWHITKLLQAEVVLCGRILTPFSLKQCCVGTLFSCSPVHPTSDSLTLTSFAVSEVRSAIHSSCLVWMKPMWKDVLGSWVNKAWRQLLFCFLCEMVAIVSLACEGNNCQHNSLLESVAATATPAKLCILWYRLFSFRCGLYDAASRRKGDVG